MVLNLWFQDDGSPSFTRQNNSVSTYVSCCADGSCKLDEGADDPFDDEGFECADDPCDIDLDFVEDSCDPPCDDEGLECDDDPCDVDLDCVDDSCDPCDPCDDEGLECADDPFDVDLDCVDIPCDEDLVCVNDPCDDFLQRKLTNYI